MFKMIRTLMFSYTILISVQSFAQDPETVIHGPSYQRYNFGIVVKNSNYTIYRSAQLGKSGIKHLSRYLEKHDLPFPKTIIYMNSAGYVFPLYFAIEQYKLSLSGEYGQFEFFHPFGEVRTYLDGQNPYYPTKDIDKARYLGPIGRQYFSLRDDGIDGGMDAVMNVMNLILDPERQPVLFHCFGGIHRTGMVAMILRFLQGGYWVDGPTTHEFGMDLNPAEYEYYKYNPVLFRKHNIEFIEEFQHDPRFLALQEQYQSTLSEDEALYFGDEPTFQEDEDVDFESTNPN